MNYTEFKSTELHNYLYRKLFNVVGSEEAINVLDKIYDNLGADDDSGYLHYIVRKTKAEGYLYESFDLYGAFTFDSTREGFHYWDLISKILENN